VAVESASCYAVGLLVTRMGGGACEGGLCSFDGGLVRPMHPRGLIAVDVCFLEGLIENRAQPYTQP
jgi:hypothetical protein